MKGEVRPCSQSDNSISSLSQKFQCSGELGRKFSNIVVSITWSDPFIAWVQLHVHSTWLGLTFSVSGWLVLLPYSKGRNRNSLLSWPVLIYHLLTPHRPYSFRSPSIDQTNISNLLRSSNLIVEHEAHERTIFCLMFSQPCLSLFASLHSMVYRLRHELLFLLRSGTHIDEDTRKVNKKTKIMDCSTLSSNFN